MNDKNSSRVDLNTLVSKPVLTVDLEKEKMTEGELIDISGGEGYGKQ